MFNSSAQLKRLRAFLNLTQDEFADKINTKRNSISMIESGRNKPTFEMIAAICKAFNISADYFLSDVDPDKKSTIHVNLGAENVNDIDIENYLTKLANLNLLYLEFYLSDIYINLKQVQQNITKVSFDRKEYEDRYQATKAQVKELKDLLKTERLTKKELVNGLLRFDEGIGFYLDAIRDLSKDILLDLSKEQYLSGSK